MSISFGVVFCRLIKLFFLECLLILEGIIRELGLISLSKSLSSIVFKKGWKHTFVN